MRYVFGVLSLLSVLSRWNCHIANGFETSSRYNPPERISKTANEKRQTIIDIDERSSKPQCPRYKYDLGLGRNKPLEAKVKRNCKNQQTDEDQGQIYRDITDGISFDVYEACRFLVEYEAARLYPTPIDSSTADSTGLEDKSLANRHSATATTQTASTKAIQSLASHANHKRNSHEIESTKEKLAATSTIVTGGSVRVVSKRTNRRKHLAKVQPKRLLEDCLTIFDHAKPGSTASASSAKSTIWSRPDTPQLDMNSVWVEMLLHDQMALSRSKS